MKIIYDSEANVYIVKVEDFETLTYVGTDDIVEAREMFIEKMTKLFNDAVSRQCNS